MSCYTFCVEVPIQYAYAVGSLVFLVFFLIFYTLNPHLHKEMLVMGLLVGFVSLATAHYWWTIDWWRPMTVTGTRIGFEDFLVGFGSGGIMAVAYEVLFRKRHVRIRGLCIHCPGPATLLLLLAFLTSWLFWGMGLTSFLASTIAFIFTAGALFYFRKDLFVNGLLSGVLMTAFSIPVYVTMSLLSPGWSEVTYLFDTLSGLMIGGIPIEEFVFWFFAGLIFGPFYEYWQGERMRKIRTSV